MGECEVDREMELKDKLYTLRKKKGYTQSELAEMLDVSRQSVSHWELGTIRPSTLRLKKLSELYSVPLEILLDDEADVQLHPKDTEGQETEKIEEQNAIPVFSKEKEKSSQKRFLKKKAIVIAVIVAILTIVIALLGYGMAAANAAREKAQLEELLNEEITVPSENSFDLTF